MQIGSYAIADDLLGDEVSRNLPGKDTKLVELAELYDGIAVEYAGTKVILYLLDGSVVYFHGGWTTATTVSRMNSYGKRNVTVRKQRDEFTIQVDGHQPVVWDGFAVLVSEDGSVTQLPSFNI